VKEWRCIQIEHHDHVGPVIIQWEAQGWRLHTYKTAAFGEAGAVKLTTTYSL
jgi:hypothetical protein